MTSRVAHRTTRQLSLEPYSHSIFIQGLEVRRAKGDGEECEVLDWVMEYTGTVGIEVVDMLAAVHEKV